MHQQKKSYIEKKSLFFQELTDRFNNLLNLFEKEFPSYYNNTDIKNIIAACNTLLSIEPMNQSKASIRPLRKLLKELLHKMSLFVDQYFDHHLYSLMNKLKELIG